MTGQGGDRLVILGSKGGPAIRPGGPSPTASLLEMGGHRIVVDCGLGVSRGVVEAGVALASIELVFVTHLHSDHVLELGPLLHTAWTSGLKSPVIVYGPEGTQAVWNGFLASLAYDIDIRILDEGRPDIRRLVEIREYGEGLVHSAPDLTVTALRVDHPPVTECFALKFKSSMQTIVFSSDTTFFKPLSEFALAADVLVHEAMHPLGVDRLTARTGNGTRLKAHLLASHTMAADVGRIAAFAEVGHLVLNHLVPADDPLITEADWVAEIRSTWQGPLTIGRDGLVINLSRAEEPDMSEQRKSA